MGIVRLASAAMVAGQIPFLYWCQALCETSGNVRSPAESSQGVGIFESGILPLFESFEPGIGQPSLGWSTGLFWGMLEVKFNGKG